MTTKSPAPAGALDGLEPRRALAQPVDLLVDRLVGDLGLAAADLEALVVAERGLRAHADLDREASAARPAPGSSPMSSCGSPTGTTCASSIAARVPGADRVAHRLVEHGLAARSRWIDHRRRRLAGAEAGDAQAAAERAWRPARRALDLVGAAPRPRTRTRDSGSSVTVVVTVVAAMSGGQRYRGAACATRLAAWLVTGPLGHLAAGLADWAVAAVAAGARPAAPPLRAAQRIPAVLRR